MNAHWFRAHHGAPTDPKWIIIAKRSETQPIVTVGIWWSLLDYASQNEDRGSIAGYDSEAIAEFYCIDHATMLRVLDVMRERGMITDDRITNWDKRQPKREDDSTERVRRHRAAKGTEGNGTKRSVTHGNARGEERRVEEKEKPKGAQKPRAERQPEKRADKAAPWMSAIRPIYRERYDADPPPQTVKALRPLVSRHGEQAVADRFRTYCERTEGRFFDPFRFATTWGEWTPNGASPPRASPLADEYAVFDDLMRVVDRMGGYRRVTSEWYTAQSEPVRRAISVMGGLKAVADADEIGFRIKRKTFAEALHAAAHGTSETPPFEATA